MAPAHFASLRALDARIAATAFVSEEPASASFTRIAIQVIREAKARRNWLRRLAETNPGASRLYGSATDAAFWSLVLGYRRAAQRARRVAQSSQIQIEKAA